MQLESPDRYSTYWSIWIEVLFGIMFPFQNLALSYLSVVKFKCLYVNSTIWHASDWNSQGDIMTTIGFLKEAPDVNIHGFNVYHKNRLILVCFLKEDFLHLYVQLHYVHKRISHSIYVPRYGEEG